MKQFNITVIATTLLLFISSFTNPFFAQTTPTIGLGWTNENGCSIYEGENYYTIEELEDLPCIQVCLGSESLFWVYGTSQHEIYWTVIGGDIISQPNNSSIAIAWNQLTSPAGVYVQIITEEGEVTEFGMCVEVIDIPKAQFSIQPPTEDLVYCLEQEIFFVNTSIPNPGGQITSYHWDFGDGNTSNQFEPSHIYGNPGVYVIELTVRNECFCLGTYRIEVTIKEMGKPVEISCPTVTCENAIETYTAEADCEFL